MSENRESEILERLNLIKNSEVPILLVELLNIRRERHRDRLEKDESQEIRGRAKECKDLIQVFS